MAISGFAWMIGGPQGSGVDSGANIFARACCYGGLHVYGNREYHSNIKGMHSYFQIRVSERPIWCHRSYVNLLGTFDAETLIRHRYDLAEGGGIIYDPTHGSTRIEDIQTIERELLAEVVTKISETGHERTIAGLLQDASHAGIRTYPIPYMSLVNEVAERIGETKTSRVVRVINVLTLGASFAILDADLGLLVKAIGTIFGGRRSVIEMNVLAARISYDYAKEHFDALPGIRLETVESKESRVFLMGSQAVGLGKLAGGCRVQTYYPITPAADESEYLESNEILDVITESEKLPSGESRSSSRERGSIVVVQTEDEIAAVNMASGASLTGVRASTSTSGPGFSLMVEGLGWAGMNEVPIVITYYQRGGPSTGLPTRHAQDDLRFAIHAGHGEFARIVLASGDIAECFYDAARAFNYAEKYQMPVIHLLDKAIANSSNTCAMFDTSNITIERGALLDVERMMQEGAYRRFEPTESGVSPRAPLGTPGLVFWNTGDEHDERGHIDENPTKRIEMMDKRMKKLALVEREVPPSERVSFFGEKESPVTIVSWGSPKGAILEARERLESEGVRSGFLQVRMLHPFPIAEVTSILGKSKKIIDVEMNYSGQLAAIIREKTGTVINDLILKYNGRPMTSDEVSAALSKSIRGMASPRQVLTHGA